MDSEKAIYFKNRKKWREWLEKNHDKEKKVYILKYKKHTGTPSLSHKEALEEAICFGWIDTTIKRLDDKTYVRRFVKRSHNSRWSKNTLGYAKKLIEEKKMAPAGMKYYLEGLKKPTIDGDIPDNPDMQDDLKKALEENSKAKENFFNFAPSYKRMYLRWIVKAKTIKTRQKRIAEVVKRAFENRSKWM